MTTEEDFQAALDANPDDWQTRGVFADWLQERDDVRAEGYRALGVCRVVPVHTRVDGWYLTGLDYPNRGWLSQGYDSSRSRRAAEDAAALAFAKLPELRRYELLNPVMES